LDYNQQFRRLREVRYLPNVASGYDFFRVK
jgi:hypothetical protein